MDSLHHEQNNFKPFIPAEKRVSEFTATSVILGIILAVLFGGGKRISRTACRNDGIRIDPGSGHLNGSYSHYLKERFRFRK